LGGTGGVRSRREGVGEGWSRAFSGGVVGVSEVVESVGGDRK